MVAVPGGSFLMGAPDSELESDSNERPQHQVQVPPFCMSKYVITVAQYQTVMRDRFYTKDEADSAMRCEWKEAVAFCEKLSKGLKQNYRLPSEAEWEYAWISDNSYTHIARGGKYDSSPKDCRSAARNLENRYGFYGFRVVCC